MNTVVSHLSEAGITSHVTCGLVSRWDPACINDISALLGSKKAFSCSYYKLASYWLIRAFQNGAYTTEEIDINVTSGPPTLYRCWIAYSGIGSWTFLAPRLPLLSTTFTFTLATFVLLQAAPSTLSRHLFPSRHCISFIWNPCVAFAVLSL